MVRRGLRASWPRVVALSKPTKLKMARTTPRRTPEGVTFVEGELGGVDVGAVAEEQDGETTAIIETERASIQSIRRAESGRRGRRRRWRRR